jgi:hypothetical protein
MMRSLSPILAPLITGTKRGWLAIRTWGMCQAKADYSAVLGYAIKRADLERRS